jgi:hypothetical protein
MKIKEVIYINYQLECACGRVFGVEAENYEVALAAMKSVMTIETVADHYSKEKKHKDDTVPTPEQIVAMVTQHLKAAEEETVTPATPEVPEEEKKVEPEAQAQVQA